MTTDQIKALLAVYEVTLKAEKENRVKMHALGVEEDFIRMYEMSPYAAEWFESLEEELKRRDEIEAVSQLIYRNCYFDPDSPKIQPLSERSQWEQVQIKKQAEAVIGYFNRKHEPLAQWEIDLLNSGKDEK